MNYSDLQGQIAAWLARDDLSQVIPWFITNAEYRVNRDLRILAMEKKVELAVTDNIATLPDDYVDMRAVYSGNCAFNYMTPEQFAEIPSGDTYGTFTTVGLSLEISSTADTVTVIYYARFPALTDAAPNNWLSDNASDVLLYAALMEAEGYEVDIQKMAAWNERYNSIVQRMNLEAVQGRYLRVRPRLPL